jgi:hypothetical protein
VVIRVKSGYSQHEGTEGHSARLAASMDRSDAIGKRGEGIFQIHIMKFCGNRDPYFNPIFLGEKNEASDFLVELVGIASGRPFFFVQVKATRLGYTKSKIKPRLKVRVSKAGIEKIRQLLAPAYLVGIDEPQGLSFIASIDDNTSDEISSLSTAYPLNCMNLRRLWIEVAAYWQGRDMTLKNSVFKT